MTTAVAGGPGTGSDSVNLPASTIALDGCEYIADTGNGLLRIVALL
jgi:hypothetical protein